MVETVGAPQKATGAKADTREYTGDDAMGFGISLPASRHLTQRAAVAAKLAMLSQGGNGSNQHMSKAANLPVSFEGVSQAQAADMLSVSRRSASVNRVNASERQVVPASSPSSAPSR